MSEVSHLFAALAHFLSLTAHAAAYGGGSVTEGINSALGLIPGGGNGDLGTLIANITRALRNLVYTVAVFAIVVAGFFLLLGFESEEAKERAKRIILYTLIGVLVVTLADEIVQFIITLHTGTIDTTLVCTIWRIMLQAIGLVALIATVMMVVAGFFLLLGFGNEGAKDTAVKIVLYAVAGILIITFASTIVGFAFVLSGSTPTFACGSLPGGVIGSIGDVGNTVINLLNIALGFLSLIAVVALIVAGFMLILGFGSEAAKDRAFRIVLYTIGGILLILFAKVIVGFFLGLNGPTTPYITVGAFTNFNTIRDAIISVLNIALGFLSLLAVVAIIVAGIMLIVGFGSEEAKDRAKRIVLYTIIGLLIIIFARVIVGFVLGLSDSISV